MTELCEANGKAMYNSLVKVMFADSCVDFSNAQLTAVGIKCCEKIASRAQEINKIFQEHPERTESECGDDANDLYVLFVDFFWIIIKTCMGSFTYKIIANAQSYENCDAYEIGDIYREMIKCVDINEHTEIEKRIF